MGVKVVVAWLRRGMKIAVRRQPRYPLAFSAGGQEDGSRLLAPSMDALPLPSPFNPSDDCSAPFAFGGSDGAVSRH
jgi:hypothetical protein